MLMLFNQQGWLLKPAWQDTVWKRSKNRILPDLRDEQKKGMTLKCCEQLDKKLQAENGPKGKEVLKHSCFADLGMMRKTPITPAAQYQGCVPSRVHVPVVPILLRR